MNQIDKEQALKPFLSEVLNSDLSSEQDKAVLYVMAALMEEVESSGEKERAVQIEQDSDGRLSAYSEKLANLQLRDISDWMKILSKAAPVVAMMLGGAASGSVDGGKLAIGILAFLSFMLGKEGIKVEFNEQDAKILLAISRIGKTFSKKKLRSELEELNKEFPGKFDIEQNLVERSLKKFVGYGVLDPDTRDDIYVVREKIKPLRQK